MASWIRIQIKKHPPSWKLTKRVSSIIERFLRIWYLLKNPVVKLQVVFILSVWFTFYCCVQPIFVNKTQLLLRRCFLFTQIYRLLPVNKTLCTYLDQLFITLCQTFTLYRTVWIICLFKNILYKCTETVTCIMLWTAESWFSSPQRERKTGRR